MKKLLLAGLLTLTLVSEVISPLSAAETSSGTTCTKNGAVKVSNSTKFVCKKIGKSFVWTKSGTSKEQDPATVVKEAPKSEPLRVLTLQGSIEAESKLRLELVEEIYLGHCASFLVYPWGIADSYEGVFYRQQKEYLIPVDLSSKENLPLSFTFGCTGYPIQSYSIEWALKGKIYTPTLKALRTPVNKLAIKNTLPNKFDLATPGEIRVSFPEVDTVENTMIFQDDGYFASETAIFFGVNKSLDNCVAKILNSQGVDVKNIAHGPGVSSTYAVAELIPSGFDRLNGFGYVSYKSSQSGELRLDIRCLGSGTYTSTFLHPAPKILINVTEGGKCPATYDNQTLPSLKRPEEVLLCKKDSSGNLKWSVIPKTKVSPTTPTSSTVALSPEEETQIKVMIKNAQSLGMKAQKIQQVLQGSLSTSASKKYSSEKIARINTLIAQAEDINSRVKKLSSLVNLMQVNAEVSQIVKIFNVLETTYADALEKS